jgi:hypothetical protein
LGLTDPAAVFGQSGIGELKAAKFRVVDISLCASTDEFNDDACVNGAEATLFLPSGGKTFYMQNPFEITA